MNRRTFIKGAIALTAMAWTNPMIVIDAADGNFRREGEWFIMDDMNRRFKNLELRTGKGTRLKITVGGREYELYKKFPLGTKIIAKTF